jgi:hypothetical protein|tara:strand:+ start:486 stop:803 length:318 start_codon:yes stop_codon:yes gene_type:complete
MSLPKTVRVAGQVVKILREDLSEVGLFGYYSHDRKVIILDKELKDEVLLNTLRHELMEASLCISGVGFCETFEQEAVVRCMDEVFFPAYERLLKRLGKHEQKKIT